MGHRLVAICQHECRRRLISLSVHQVWAAPLMGGGRAVVMFNRHVSSDEKFDEHNMTLHWSMIGLPVEMEVCVGLTPEHPVPFSFARHGLQK